jgi:hypothetical protein
MEKCGKYEQTFSDAAKYCISFSASIFTKLAPAQLSCEGLSYTEFNTSRLRNAEEGVDMYLHVK